MALEGLWGLKVLERTETISGHLLITAKVFSEAVKHKICLQYQIRDDKNNSYLPIFSQVDQNIRSVLKSLPQNMGKIPDS
jgi:hypothetical protein